MFIYCRLEPHSGCEWKAVLSRTSHPLQPNSTHMRCSTKEGLHTVTKSPKAHTHIVKVYPLYIHKLNHLRLLRYTHTYRLNLQFPQTHTHTHTHTHSESISTLHTQTESLTASKIHSHLPTESPVSTHTHKHKHKHTQTHTHTHTHVFISTWIHWTDCVYCCHHTQIQSHTMHLQFFLH